MKTLCAFCSKEVLLTDKYCVYCGKKLNPIDLLMNNSSNYERSLDSNAANNTDSKPMIKGEDTAPRPYKDNNRISPKIVILACTAVFTTSLLVFLIMFFNPTRTTYRSAMTEFKSGNYKEASDIFSTIPEYDDSSVMLNKSLYELARQKMESSDYYAARAIYEQLGSFKNASQLALECNYMAAQEKFNAEQWFEAYKLFHEIPDYKDSNVFSLSCLENLVGVILNTNGIYSDQEVIDAYLDFSTIESDSRVDNIFSLRREGICYSLAVAYYNQGNLLAAIDYLSSCSTEEAMLLYRNIQLETNGVAFQNGFGKYYSVTAEPNLRVRSSPSLQGKIIGKLQFGAIIEVYEIYGEWARINYNGKTGWVSFEYLEITA